VWVKVQTLQCQTTWHTNWTEQCVLNCYGSNRRYLWKTNNTTRKKWSSSEIGSYYIISHSSAYSNGAQNEKRQQIQICVPYNIHLYTDQTFWETVRNDSPLPLIKSMGDEFSKRKRFKFYLRRQFSHIFLVVKQAHALDLLTFRNRASYI
jgi:hypothetical protein